MRGLDLRPALLRTARGVLQGFTVVRQALVRHRRAATWGVVAIAVAGAGFFGYMKLVEEGFVRYNKWDRRIRGTLRAGDQAPDVELTRFDGSRLRLSALWREKPLVLVFGSCT